MSKRIRTHKSRAIFAQELPTLQTNTSTNDEYDYFQSRYKNHNTSTPTNANEPIINFQNDNIVLTNDNYKPNEALMDMLGFNELAPFIESKSKGKKTIDKLHNNNYNDYNESGFNDINGGDYRQRLIKQMQDSMFKQSNAMFGSTEHFKANEEPDYNDIQNTSYQSSNAQAVYLQRQSKKLFKNMNNH